MKWIKLYNSKSKNSEIDRRNYNADTRDKGEKSWKQLDWNTLCMVEQQFKWSQISVSPEDSE